MRLSVSDIERAFRELLDGSRAREEVAEWASLVIGEDDQESLVFEPAAEEGRMRSAIHYLAGVDLRDGPDSYLHINKDFEDYFHQWTKKTIHS